MFAMNEMTGTERSLFAFLSTSFFDYCFQQFDRVHFDGQNEPKAFGHDGELIEGLVSFTTVLRNSFASSLRQSSHDFVVNQTPFISHPQSPEETQSERLSYEIF